MKKLAGILVAGALVMGLVGCGGSATPSSQSTDMDTSTAQQTPAPKPAEPLSLVGEWEQSNKNDEANYQIATITDGTIEVYWIMNGGDTKSLYWAGSYDAPKEATDTYSWDSKNDTTKTASALLAANSETKKFSYSNNELTYEVTALGTTTTVRMAMK